MRPTIGFFAAVTLLAGAGLFLWLGNPFGGTELAGSTGSGEPSRESSPEPEGASPGERLNEPYEVMSGPYEDGGGAVSMNIETDAETPAEMEAVGKTVRQDYPEPGRLALTMIYHSGESHTPAVETGFVAFEGEGIEVTSYVSEHKMLCDRAYAYEEPDASPEWACWRWHDPVEDEEPEGTPTTKPIADSVDYEVMKETREDRSTYSMLTMGVDTQAETPDEMRLVAAQVRDDNPQAEIINIFFFFVPAEDPSMSVETGHATVARDLAAAEALEADQGINLSSYENEGMMNVDSFVERQRRGCEGWGYSEGEEPTPYHVSPPSDWGCFRFE